MKIVIWGAAGFIGINLIGKLLDDENNELLLVDEKKDYFPKTLEMNKRVKIVEFALCRQEDFDSILAEQEIVYHLVSSSSPSTSNIRLADEIEKDILWTSKLFDACVRNQIKRVIFISSGGTVYGKDNECPLDEFMPTNPISSYGLQKMMIEKMLYLYNCIYGLDYRIVRLSNPFGPYQRPNGKLGVISTFLYKALKEQDLIVYGDGTVVRDFIYIDDAIDAIINVSSDNAIQKLYNIGSGIGMSINDIVQLVQKVTEQNSHVEYISGRPVDVPINYLDVSRYEREWGNIVKTPIENGMKKTIEYLQILIEGEKR